MKKYKHCQSCGMPLKKDPKGGATNKDGTVNCKFCSHCYENGEFKQPTFTALQMQALVKDKMKAMGFPGLIAGFFTNGIPKLERWKNQ